MASARQAALAARRSTGYGGDKIRILAPVQTGISSVAKQNAANETDIMIAKYNAGQIGNAEMKAFLQAQVVSPYTSASDKVQIQTKLQDFDVLIEKDRLEAAFKSAPENSLQKEQAAQALAQFYTNRASTMVAGTPAQSQALENAGIWQQNVKTIQDSVSRQQRKNLENQLLQRVNSLPTSSSQRSQAMADMYKQLYDMANSQGDPEDAQAYAAKYQQALTMQDQYTQQEAVQSQATTRKELINELNIRKNEYQTGKITADQYYSYLDKVNTYAMENNDGTLQNTVTSEASRVAKIEAKGGLNRGTAGGLPVVLKGYGGTGGGGVKTSWDLEDFQYNQGLKLAQQFLKEGQTPDGQAYTPQDYQNDIAGLVQTRAMKLDERTSTIEAMAAENPNAKITYDGKKQRVVDILASLNKEQVDIQPQADAAASGTFAIMEVAPSQFTKAGAFKTSGKSIPEYQVFDTNSIPPELKSLIVADDMGIYHQAYRRPIEITRQEYEANSFDNQNYYPDKNTGKYYKLSNQLSVDLYQPDKSKIGQTVDIMPGEPVKSLETIQRDAEQANEDAAKAIELKKNTIDATMVAPLPPKPPLQQIKEAAKPVIEGATKIAQQGVQKVQEALPQVGEQIGQTFQNINTKVQPVVQQVQKTVTQAPFQTINQAINKPSSTPLSNSYNAPIVKTVNNVPSVKQYDVNQGFVYKPITTPPAPAPAPAPKPPSIGTVLAGAAGQAVNKIKSIFKW